MPELRNLIVVDNAEEESARLERLRIKSLVDWREILLWRDNTIEGRKLNEIKNGLGKDDVINLQFTRYIAASDVKRPFSHYSYKWDDGTSESSFGM
jgi:hypothetical protein